MRTIKPRADLCTNVVTAHSIVAGVPRVFAARKGSRTTCLSMDDASLLSGPLQFTCEQYYTSERRMCVLIHQLKGQRRKAVRYGLLRTE